MESPEVEFPLLFLEARIILKAEINSVHVYEQPLNIVNLLPKIKNEKECLRKKLKKSTLLALKKLERVAFV